MIVARSPSLMLPFVFALVIVCIKSLQSDTHNDVGIPTFKDSRPNILFFVIDDLGWTDISHHNAEYKTPNIDALYKNGIELTNYYVHLDCSPTRSSMLTGKYAWKNGLQNIGTIPPGSTQHIPFDTPTLPELMKSAGYDTHGLGKWHLGYAAWNMTPIERGFDSYMGIFQGAGYYYTHRFLGPNVAFDGFDFFDDKKVFTDAVGNYSAKLYTDRLISILDEYDTNKGKGRHKAAKDPFFIYMAYQTVHTPIERPPKAYATCLGIDNEMRKIYCEQMLYFDEKLGEIIRTLKHNGLYDNTLIVLSTDNGGMPYWANQNTPFQAALSYGCNLPYRAGKATLFEGGIKGIGLLSGHLIVRAGLAGTQNDILTHCSDWLTTFVEGVAGHALPNDIDFDGLNIMNALGENAATWNRTELYVNIDNVDFNGDPATFAAIIYNETETNTVWKYINGLQVYTNYYYCNQTQFGPIQLNQTEWLFNITDNPYEYEEKNLMAVYPQMAKELNAKIEDQIENGGFVPGQDRTVYREAFPAANDGVWYPWLG